MNNNSLTLDSSIEIEYYRQKLLARNLLNQQNSKDGQAANAFDLAKAMTGLIDGNTSMQSELT